MYAMRHLFGSWHSVARRLASAPLIALFLDFDGTLAHLGPRPDEVPVDSGARHALAAITRSPRFRVWVISGRRHADVRDRVRVAGIRYLGLYGWEARCGMELGEETRRALACLLRRIQRSFASFRGVRVEEKQHALTVDHRAASEEEVVRAGHVLKVVVAPFTDLFRTEAGRNAWEVVPRELGDKGLAVLRELAALPRGALPVYLGDDQADEAAFAALPSGITVRVGGNRPSRARYRLAGVAQVRTFLHRLKSEFA